LKNYKIILCENRAFVDGKMVLSPNGAEILIKEIESKFVGRA
jgi:hypothetical protein